MAEETVVFARKASGLVREMSWWDVLLITIAGPAASGMTYYSVRIPGQYPGGNTVLAFFLGGLIWALPVLLIAVYASSFPRSGAMYVVISRAIHPIVGFLPNWLWVVSSGFTAGFLNYLGLNLISAGLQTGGIMANSSSLTGAGNWLAGHIWGRFFIALGMTVIVWGMELLGMDRLKWFIRVIVYVPLVVTIAALIYFFVTNGNDAFNAVYGAGVHDKITAAADAGIAKSGGLMSAGSALKGMFLAVFWAYSALEAISFVGSEVKTPRTSFIRGMGFGFIAVMALYMLNSWAPGVSFGNTFIRDYSWLYYNDLSGLEKILGATAAQPSIPFYAGISAGAAWVAILFCVAFFFWYLNTSVICWMGAVRGVFAMAFDRQIPLGLCKVSKRGTPTTATHFIAFFAVIGCFIGVGDAGGNAGSANMLAIMDFTGLFFIWGVGLAGLFLPFTRPELFEKTTFQYKVGGIPLMAIFGFLALGIGWYITLLVGTELSTNTSELGMAALISVGLGVVAWMYNKNRKEGIDPTMIYAQIPPA
jgi:basic amino acid/polyamine antiporter, APA family